MYSVLTTQDQAERINVAAKQNNDNQEAHHEFQYNSWFRTWWSHIWKNFLEVHMPGNKWSRIKM